MISRFSEEISQSFWCDQESSATRTRSPPYGQLENHFHTPQMYLLPSDVWRTCWASSRMEISTPSLMASNQKNVKLTRCCYRTSIGSETPTTYWRWLDIYLLPHLVWESDNLINKTNRLSAKSRTSDRDIEVDYFNYCDRGRWVVERESTIKSEPSMHHLMSQDRSSQQPAGNRTRKNGKMKSKLK